MSASTPQPTPTISKHCGAVRKDGLPCKAPATVGDYCPSHAPELQERMAAARRKGGRNRSTAQRAQKLVPAHLQPVFGLLAQALVEVYNGALPPQQATAMASLAGAMVRVLTSGEMEERLRALEEQAAGQRRAA